MIPHHFYFVFMDSTMTQNCNGAISESGGG